MLQVVVFNVDDRPVPIVHRIIRVHEKEDRSIDVLTKVLIGMAAGCRCSTLYTLCIILRSCL